MFNLPSLDEQKKLVEQLYAMERNIQKLVETIENLSEKSKLLKYAQLAKIFGQPKDLLLRNPTFRDLIRLKGKDPEADFWIQRSGQDKWVGKPFHRNSPKFQEMEDEADWSDRSTYERGKT